MTKAEEKQELTAEVFSRLYDEYYNMIRQVVVEYESDAETVTDLVQDIYARAWERKDQYRGDAQASTWLYRIAESVCANHVRDTVERSPVILSEHDMSRPTADDYDGSWLEQNYVDADDPESLLIAEEEAALGYNGLSPQEEQVFDFMYVQGLTAVETAERLGLAHSTVRVVARNVRNKIS